MCTARSSMSVKLRRAGWTVLAVLLISAMMSAAAGVSLADASRNTGVTSYRLEIPGSTIQTAAFSPDGRFLAAGHIKFKHDEHQYEFATGIAIWDLASRKWVADKIVDSATLRYGSPRHRTIEPEFLNYTSDGKRLVVFQGGVIRILDAASLAEESHIDLDLPLYAEGNEQATLWDVKVPPGDSKLAVLVGGFPSHNSGLLRVYDIFTKRVTFEWKIEAYLNGASMSFSSDGSKISVVVPERIMHRRGEGHPDVALLDLKLASLKLWLDTGPDTALSAVFVDNNQLVTAHMWNERHMKRGSLKFWDVNTGKMTREISDAPSGIHRQVDISRDGRILFGYIGQQENAYHSMKTVDQRFRLWELPSGNVIVDSADIVPIAKLTLPQFRLSPDGKTAVALWPTSLVQPEVFEIVPPGGACPYQ